MRMREVDCLDRLLFLKRFVSAPGRVGSPLPSSVRLAERVAADLPWEQCHAVAEFGSGTGRVTEALVRRSPPGCSLLLFEADPGFRSHLRRRYPALPVYPDACQLGPALAERGLDEVSAVVSGIPFTVMEPGVREEILAQVRDHLAPDGLFLAYQFTPSLCVHARRLFGEVRVRWMPWNLPPMLLIECRR